RSLMAISDFPNSDLESFGSGSFNTRPLPEPFGVGLPDLPSVRGVFDPGEISGAATSSAAAQAAQLIEEVVSEGGGSLYLPYGRHLIAGNLLAKKTILGTPNQIFAIVGLGEGQSNGGFHGEWEAAEAVYYAGNPLSVSPNGSTEGYRFYRGY